MDADAEPDLSRKTRSGMGVKKGTSYSILLTMGIMAANGGSGEPRGREGKHREAVGTARIKCRISAKARIGGLSPLLSSCSSGQDAIALPHDPRCLASIKPANRQPWYLSNPTNPGRDLLHLRRRAGVREGGRLGNANTSSQAINPFDTGQSHRLSRRAKEW